MDAATENKAPTSDTSLSTQSTRLRTSSPAALRVVVDSKEAFREFEAERRSFNCTLRQSPSGRLYWESAAFSAHFSHSRV